MLSNFHSNGSELWPTTAMDAIAPGGRWAVKRLPSSVTKRLSKTSLASPRATLAMAPAKRDWQRLRLAEHYLRRYPSRARRVHSGCSPWEGFVGITHPSVREISALELARSDTLRADFLALHRAWIDRGLSRWLSLIAPTGMRPVLVLGAFDSTDTLLGAVIGVWHSTPCDRFDDLLEQSTAYPVTARPADGAWHLIAVTTSAAAQARNLGLARLLLGHSLATLGASGHARVRTLSPVLGLPELLTVWTRAKASQAAPNSAELTSTAQEQQLVDAVLHAARDDGRPALQIMRLHLGGGARLESILHESRHDDGASARINLRFAYATDPTLRLAQKEAWLRWTATRAASLVPVGVFDGAPLYRASDASDRLIWDGANE